jgi:hypothetical protein
VFPQLSAPLEYFGRASLFVYWIHVEMVYGVMSVALHKRLTFEGAVVAFLLFSAFLFGVAKTKDYLVQRWKGKTSDEPRRRRAAEQPDVLG